MRSRQEIVVVGGGAIGLLTAVECVRAGARVELVDQAGIPGPLATSNDRYRAVRALHRGDETLTLAAARGRQGWADTERMLGARFCLRTGALTVMPAADVTASLVMLATADTPARAVPAEALARRYSMLRLAAGDAAVFEPVAGMVLASEALHALAGWLGEQPAVTLRPGHQVTEVGDGLVRLADGSVLRGDGVVIAAGPWSRDLLPATVAGDLTLLRQTMLTYVPAPAWPSTPVVLGLGPDRDAWLMPPAAGTPARLSAASACRVVPAMAGRATPARWRDHLTGRFARLLTDFDPARVTAAADGYYLSDLTGPGPRLRPGRPGVGLSGLRRHVVQVRPPGGPRAGGPCPGTAAPAWPAWISSTGPGRKDAMKLLGLEAVQNATYYQSRYQQIEEFGADLFVLNGLGDPDFWPRNRYRIVGSKHIDDIVAAAREWHAIEHFDGVLSFSESAVIAVAAVADALGLPGIGTEVARTSRNKLLMRQAHERGDVARPHFRLAQDLPAALGAAAEFGYPVIIKPTLGAASNFVFRVDDPGQMRLRFPQVAAGMQQMSWFVMEPDGVDHGPHGVLVESFLDGPEYLTEALAWDGEVFLGSIVDRVTVEGATFDDDVHHAPTSLDPGQIAAVHQLITAAARAQGIRRSVMHAEVRYHQGRPHMLEIAVRPGGGGLDYFARISAGYSPIRVMMDVACGRAPGVSHYHPTDVHTAGLCLISEPGRVEQITVPAAVSESSRIFFLKITAQPGDVIKRPPNGNNILGFLCTTGTSLQDAMQVAGELAAQLDVRISALVSTERQ